MHCLPRVQSTRRSAPGPQVPSSQSRLIWTTPKSPSFQPGTGRRIGSSRNRSQEEKPVWQKGETSGAQHPKMWSWPWPPVLLPRMEQGPPSMLPNHIYLRSLKAAGRPHPSPTPPPPGRGLLPPSENIPAFQRIPCRKLAPGFHPLIPAPPPKADSGLSKTLRAISPGPREPGHPDPNLNSYSP
jgi:hypothetical protein